MNRFATITSKGQVTIPKDVRERLSLKEGDNVAFVSVNEGVLLVPRNKPVESVFGMLAEYGRPGTTIADYDSAVRDAVVDHVERARASKADDAA